MDRRESKGARGKEERILLVGHERAQLEIGSKPVRKLCHPLLPTLLLSPRLLAHAGLSRERPSRRTNEPRNFIWFITRVGVCASA